MWHAGRSAATAGGDPTGTLLRVLQDEPVFLEARHEDTRY
jgi:hypothetical protein